VPESGIRGRKKADDRLHSADFNQDGFSNKMGLQLVLLREEGAMALRKVDDLATEAQRKEVFLALVEAQDRLLPATRDRRLTLAQSRQVVAERFGISEGQIRQIEQEGIDGDWPPL
jgi:hypothetical protein